MGFKPTYVHVQVTALGVLCCFDLVCLFDLACFFLSSFSSLIKNMYNVRVCKDIHVLVDREH